MAPRRSSHCRYALRVWSLLIWAVKNASRQFGGLGRPCSVPPEILTTEFGRLRQLAISYELRNHHPLSSARRFSPRSSSRPWSTSNSQGPAIVHIRRTRVTHFSVTPELSIIDRAHCFGAAEGHSACSKPSQPRARDRHQNGVGGFWLLAL
jgi:hypothetical protein